MREHGGLFAGDQGPGKETADEQGMIRGVQQSRCGHHHWSEAQRELQGQTQQLRAGISATGLQGSATLLCGVSCVDAALACAVGEEGGGEVEMRTGVLLAAHVQRARSMLDYCRVTSAFTAVHIRAGLRLVAFKHPLAAVS